MAEFNYIIGYNPLDRSARLTPESLISSAVKLCHEDVGLTCSELMFHLARQLVGDTDYGNFVLLTYAVADTVREAEVRAQASAKDLSDSLGNAGMPHAVWKSGVHKLWESGARKPLAALVTADDYPGHTTSDLYLGHA
ncbi:hypothetical protein HYU15_02975 [Candidatus Woesearchaeota archaeon]|nr:hypothetical protein [Candidatus Woesearchaeota archaeon]